MRKEIAQLLRPHSVFSSDLDLQKTRGAVERTAQRSSDRKLWARRLDDEPLRLPREDPPPPPAETVARRSANTPAKKPTATSSIEARLRHNHDPAAVMRQHVLQSSSPLRDSRPAGEPFTEVSDKQMKKLVEEVDRTGDVSQLDGADNFRQTLTPELQREYDRQVEELRNDPRVKFSYHDGATQSAATEDLALRGIVAANFGNPRGMEDIVRSASGPDGTLEIDVYGGPVPIEKYYGGDPRGAQGLALPQGGIAIEQPFLYDATRRGDNPFVHEFAHVQQQTETHENEFHAGELPPDFADPGAFRDAFDEDGFQDYVAERFTGGPRDPGEIVNGGNESFPTVQNLFRQAPQDLKRESPELYRQMVEYSGYDPLARESSTPRRGSLGQAAPVVRDNFELFGGGDDHVSREDLEKIANSNSSNVTAEARAAAVFLLSSDASRSMLDVGAGRGNVDDKISRDDLDGALEELAPHGNYWRPTAGVNGAVNTEDEARIVLDRFEALADTAAGRGGRDENISDRDLRALIADPGVPPEVKAAARVLLAA